MVSSNVLGVVASNVLGVVSSNVLGVVSSNVLGVVSSRCGSIQCARCGVIQCARCGVIQCTRCTMGSNGNRVVLKAMTQCLVVNHYLDTIVKLQGRFSFFFYVCSCVTLGYLFLSIGWSRPDT